MCLSSRKYLFYNGVFNVNHFTHLSTPKMFDSFMLMIIYFKPRQNTFGANKLFSYKTSKVILYIRLGNINGLE